MDKNQPVDIIIVAPTAIDGEHLAVATVIKKCPVDLAFELAGAGKARVYSKELESELKKQVAAEEAAAKERAAQQTLAGAGVNAAAIADALSSAIAQGVQAALASITPLEPAAPAAPAAE